MTTIPTDRRKRIEQVIAEHQPTEGGLYDEGSLSRNLLSVVRMIRLDVPLGVENLIKISDNLPLSLNRTRSGGWSPVWRLT